MKLTKKLIITAGVFLQLAGSLYGSAAWQTAFLQFGGGNDVALDVAHALLESRDSIGLRP